MQAVPTAREIMKTTARVIHPNVYVLDAMSMLHSKAENAAMVVDDEYRLVGILSAKDCLRVLLGEVYDRFEVSGRARVADFMSPLTETLTPGMDIFAIASVFLRADFTSLPVLDDGVLVGSIARLDMLAAIVDMAKRSEAGQAQVRERIQIEEHPRSIRDLLRLAGDHDKAQLSQVLSKRHHTESKKRTSSQE